MQTQAQLGAIDRQPFFYLPTWRLQLRILMLEIAPLQAIQNTGVTTPLSHQIDQRSGIGAIVALKILTAGITITAYRCDRASPQMLQMLAGKMSARREDQHFFGCQHRHRP